MDVLGYVQKRLKKIKKEVDIALYICYIKYIGQTNKEGNMYYIYEKETTYIIGKPDRNGLARPDHRQSYKTLGAAKAGLTRLIKAENLLPTDSNYGEFRYAIAASAFFHQNIEKQVKKKNLMDPSIEFMEPVNRPYYCSPSSETYWSM